MSNADRVVSADELKELVRAYAAEHLPGWACGSVMLRRGEGANLVIEEILVLPIPELSLASR